MSSPSNLVFRRYVSLAGSILAALGAGTNYAYSAYAPQLGQRLQISSTQLNIIGTSGNLGVYLSGPAWGRVADSRGPRIPLVSACVLLLFGYLGLRMCYDRVLSIQPSSALGMGLLVLFGFCTGSGGNAGLTSAINATAKSFHDRTRATATAVVLSGFGLSAFVFSTIAGAFFPGDTSSFLLTVALGTSFAMFIAFFVVRIVPHAPEDSAERASAETEGSELGETTDEDIADDEALEEEGPTSSSGLLGSRSLRGSARGSFELSPPRSSSPTVVHRRHAKRIARRLRRSELNKTLPDVPKVDIHGRELLIHADFWILFAILSCLSGTGLMYINNVGSIAQALHNYNNPGDFTGFAALQATQVSLISIFNCLGRILIGVSSDVAHANFGARRSYSLAFVSISFIISQIVAKSVERATSLWIASCLLGISYGAVFGIMPMVSLEWFGMTHFSQNWGFLSLSPIVGGNIFNLFFGHVYDSHSRAVTASAGGAVDNSRQCYDGRLCYAESLTVSLLACCAAFVLSLVAAWRDRQRARRDEGWERIDREEPRK